MPLTRTSFKKGNKMSVGRKGKYVSGKTIQDVLGVEKFEENNEIVVNKLIEECQKGNMNAIKLWMDFCFSKPEIRSESVSMEKKQVLTDKEVDEIAERFRGVIDDDNK
jgi:hypothetical protein